MCQVNSKFQCLCVYLLMQTLNDWYSSWEEQITNHYWWYSYMYKLFYLMLEMLSNKYHFIKQKISNGYLFFPRGQLWFLSEGKLSRASLQMSGVLRLWLVLNLLWGWCYNNQAHSWPPDAMHSHQEWFW